MTIMQVNNDFAALILLHHPDKGNADGAMAMMLKCHDDNDAMLNTVKGTTSAFENRWRKAAFLCLQTRSGFSFAPQFGTMCRNSEFYWMWLPDTAEKATKLHGSNIGWILAKSKEKQVKWMLLSRVNTNKRGNASSVIGHQPMRMPNRQVSITSVELPVFYHLCSLLDTQQKYNRNKGWLSIAVIKVKLEAGTGTLRDKESGDSKI